MTEQIEILTVVPDANPDVDDAMALIEKMPGVVSIEAGSFAMGGDGLTVKVTAGARAAVVAMLTDRHQFKIVEGGAS